MEQAIAADVSQFEADDTARLELLGIDEEPLLYNNAPVALVMYGPGSDEFVRAQAKVERAEQARLYQAVRGKANKESSEELRRALVEKLTACTRSVENFPLAARDIYSNPKLGYITDQAAKFIGDWKNFKKGLPKP